MPANVSPEFLAKKARFESAKTPGDRVRALQEMISELPKHKGSEKLHAQLKKKLAVLKKEQVVASRKKAGGGGGLTVKKEGNAQVVLVGFPSSGKSSLLAAVTNAKPLIADYPYTTQAPEVGTMKYSNVDIQLVEVPAISEGTYYSERGSALFGLLRTADGIILVVDARDAQRQFDSLLEEIKLAGLSEKPCLVALNKADISSGVKLKTPLSVIPISASGRQNLERLRDSIWLMLGKMRVYTKKGDRQDDRPMVLSREATVRDLVKLVHKEMLESFRFARIWRKNSMFSGQRVGLDFLLKDEDVAEIFA